MKRLPTDLQILDAIYNRYYARFAAYSEEDPDRSSKVYVPIDIDEIASEFQVDGDIIFGRLYYHLEGKYRYKQENESTAHLFTVAVGEDRHCVNFPYVASVLADLRDEKRKYRTVTVISIIALVVSAASFLFSMFS